MIHMVTQWLRLESGSRRLGYRHRPSGGGAARIWWIVGVALGGLVAASAGIVLAHRSPAPSSHGAASSVVSTSPSASAAAPTAAEQDALVSDLVSGQPAKVARAVAMPAGQKVPASAIAALKALAPVTVDTASYTQNSPNTANLTVTDHHGTRWTLHMIFTQGAWAVLDSVHA